MADIFLSYAREDENRLAGLVEALERRGLSVWWDRQIAAGSDYESVIEAQLAAASCTVVALSKAALASEFVRNEAAEARERGMLLPVLLEDVRVPLSLKHVQCADLRAWPQDDSGLNSLVERIRELVGATAEDTSPTLVGRDAELDQLRRVFRRVEQRQGSLVLLNGEPGVGKTALIQTSVADFARRGALVVAGECYDEQGAPPYAPWVQILNQVLAEVPPTDALLADADLLLAAMSGLHLEYEIAPALLADRVRLPDGAEYLADARYRMFECITAYLLCVAEMRPLVVVLEDLHWSDQATLRLLEFLVRRTVEHSVLVLASYRDVEVRRDHPLFDALAGLNRQPNTHRLRLGGLSDTAVAELLGKRLTITLPRTLAEKVYQHTEGNPLFVTELIQVIADELAANPDGPIEVHVPEGIRETIGHRLNRLSPGCNQLLLMASLLGIDFSQAELAPLFPELSAIELLRHLEEAETAGLIRDRQSLGQYGFTHALIRETLYEEIPLTRRVMLHGNVASTLETLYAARPESVVARIALHAYKSAQAGNIDRAVDYALRAARQSESSFAYEEALRFYGMALDCLQMDPADRRRQMAEVYFAMGRSGENAGLLHLDRKYAHFAQRAVQLARDVGESETLARAACDYAKASYFAGDATSVLDEALALEDISPISRTQCLCFRAIATKHQGRRDEAERYAQEALEHAQQTDGSQVALAWTQLALAGRPEKLSERIRIGTQAAALAEAAGDWLCMLQAYRWLVMGLLESGKVRQAREALARHRACADRLRSTHWLGITIVAEAAFALLDGRWEDAEALIDDGERRGLGVYGQGASGTYAVQMHLLQRETGQLQRHAPLLIPHVKQRLAHAEDAQLWNLPGLCVELGLHDEARNVFKEVMRDNLAVLPRDDLFSTHLVNLIGACTELEERDFAQPLYSALLPYAGQLIMHELALCMGPADMYLGELAALMNRRSESVGHYDRALALATTIESRPWQAHVLQRYGLLLARSSSRDEREHGSDQIKRARGLALQLAMTPLARRCDDLLAGGADVLPDNLTPRELELLKLIAAGRSNKDISRVLEISLNTVATHVRSILVKTHSANRTEAAAYALQKGLV